MNPPLSISVDAPGAEMNYFGAGDSLAHVAALLEAGSAASAVIRNEDARIRYGLITNPRFNGSGSSLWMGTIEIGQEEWTPAWDSLLEETSLRFVCVGLEEGVELCDAQIDPDRFPWTEWPLLIGAVRSGESPGAWFIRKR